MNRQKQITKDIIILYHAECNDGFGAAWAAWKKFGDKADYIPVSHNFYPDNFTNKEIYTLDLTLPKEITEKFLETNKRLTSIDHHISVKDITEITQDYSFDINHSGAVLAWKYFHPDKPVPKLLLFVEDSDLWKSEYPETLKITLALGLFDFNFEIWDKIAEDVENPERLKDYLMKGEVISNYEKKLLDYLERQAQLVEFERYKVYAINTPRFLRNYIAHTLSKKLPPFAISWVQEKDRIEVSLRSDGSVDVSEIAKKYGGGGHKAAAGFSFPADQPFPWKIIKE